MYIMLPLRAAGGFNALHARGTLATPTTVVDGDYLGNNAFGGHDGTNFIATAALGARVNGTVTTGTIPTDLVFLTGTTSVGTEKFRITSGGNISIGGITAFGTSAAKVLGFSSGTAPTTFPADMAQMCVKDQAAGNACFHFYTELGQIIKLYQQAALTAALTGITSTAPGTPDYALQDLVQNTGFGFATKDEGNSLLAVVANLQTRVGEIATRLANLGLTA